MKLSRIYSPKNIMLSTLLTGSLCIATCNANNKVVNSCFEKQKTELSEKKSKNIDIVEVINNYDSRVIKNIKNEKISPSIENSKSKTYNNVFGRVLIGAVMAAIGGLVGSIREVDEKKLIATTKQGVVTGAIIGTLIPGIASGIVLTAGISTLAGIAGTFFSKGNAAIGKISAGITGLLAALKFFI